MQYFNRLKKYEISNSICGAAIIPTEYIYYNKLSLQNECKYYNIYVECRNMTY